MDKRTAKIIPPYGIDAYTSIPNPEHAVANGPSHRRPSVIGFLSGHKGSKSHEENEKPVYDPKFHQTIIKSNSGLPVKTHTRLNTPKRGLYLDSLHFSNVYCRHKLEIMLRISKPDPECPSKLRHYEVLIDTPIFLVSEQCNSGNMELPTYDMATMEGKGNQVPLSMNSDFLVTHVHLRQLLKKPYPFQLLPLSHRWDHLISWPRMTLIYYLFNN